MFLLEFISGLLLSGNSEPEEKCDFRCWFRKLNITIDKIHTNLSKKIIFSEFAFDVDIINLSIFNMDLVDISASFYPNPNVIENGIMLDIVADADMSCVIKLDQTKGRIGIHEVGRMSADAKEISLKLPLIFQKGKDGLIESVVVGDKCSGSMEDLDLDIKIDTSSFFNWLFTFFKSFVKSFIMNNIGSLICTNAPIGDSITQGFSMANKIIRPFLNDTDPIFIPIGPNMADLRKSAVVDVIRFLLTEFIGIGGPLNLNSLFNRFTNNTGRFQLSSITKYFGLAFPVYFSIPIKPLDACINISINEFNFSGMNTWSDFTFFEPSDEHTLDTHTAMTDLGINSSFTINVSTNGSMVNTGGSYLSEEADLIMYMRNNSMDFKLQVASPEAAGANYKSAQFFDPICIEKLLSPEGTGLTFIKFVTDIDVISLEASKEDLEIEIRTFINNIVKFFITNYEQIIPVFINSFINDYAVPYVNNMVNSTLQKGDCMYQPEYPYKQYVFMTTITAVSIGTFLTIIMLLIVCIVQKRTDTNSLNSSILNSINTDDYTGDKKPFLLDSSENSSLLMTDKLPLFVRILIPFLIFINISLFFSSNTGIGASVFAKFKIDQKLISMPSLFDFGLINSIKDMWEGHAYALSILICKLSIIKNSF